MIERRTWAMWGFALAGWLGAVAVMAAARLIFGPLKPGQVGTAWILIPTAAAALAIAWAFVMATFAFRRLGLERVYASIIPANAPSLRLFEKLGHRRDDGPTARRHADEADDVTLSLPRDRFDERHGPLAARVRIARRRGQGADVPES